MEPRRERASSTRNPTSTGRRANPVQRKQIPSTPEAHIESRGAGSDDTHDCGYLVGNLVVRPVHGNFRNEHSTKGKGRGSFSEKGRSGREKLLGSLILDVRSD